MILTEISVIDEVLDEHRGALGKDFVPYRNHVYRVANLCAAMAPGPSDAVATEKIGIAAAFHDLGIWTDGTFDYLGPSIGLARDYLVAAGRSAWVEEISETILQHHKVTAYKGGYLLVEPFRRADWIDVTTGLLRFGLPPALLRDLYEEWPGAGFHRNLVRLELRHLGKHPLNPIPMFKW